MFGLLFASVKIGRVYAEQVRRSRLKRKCKFY